MNWTNQPWLAVIKARIMRAPPASDSTLMVMRASVERYRQQIDGEGPPPTGYQLAALIREAVTLETQRQQLALRDVGELLGLHLDRDRRGEQVGRRAGTPVLPLLHAGCEGEEEHRDDPESEPAAHPWAFIREAR